MKRALVTGVTGQDGSYLAELLLDKGYLVDGLVRRASRRDESNLFKVRKHPRFRTVTGDLEDSTRMSGIIKDGQYDEVYNLGAQSFVRYSFDNPIQAAHVNYLGCVYLVESIKQHSPQTRFYQASTSEMYGGVLQSTFLDENTRFHPRSPYGVAKLAAYWHVRGARDGYGLFTCNGILFNHESPRRGDEFVTQKVVKAAAEYKGWNLWGEDRDGDDKVPLLEIGNMEACRDWGDARDYVHGMWLMLQNDKAGDYVLATGKAHSVRDLVEKSFEMAGTKIRWEGEGVDEVGYDDFDTPIVKINAEHYRPTEVDVLLGNSQKARDTLGWNPRITFEGMIQDMFDAAYADLYSEKVKV